METTGAAVTQLVNSLASAGYLTRGRAVSEDRRMSSGAGCRRHEKREQVLAAGPRELAEDLDEQAIDAAGAVLARLAAPYDRRGNLYHLIETADRVRAMGTEAARIPARGEATEQRLIAAAERLFAEHGVGAVSLRTVMQAARTNVAAIHYHFGSKEGLLDAVLRSRLDQVTGERNAVLRESPGKDVAARDLARAFVRPVVAVLESGGECWIRLVGRLLATGGDGLDAVAESFFERNAAFVDQLDRLSPGVPRRTLDFRLSQAMTVTLNVLGDVGRTRRLHSADEAGWTDGQIVDDLVDVVTSMLAGPPGARRRK